MADTRDYFFRIPSVAAFVSDLQALCSALGYPNIVPSGWQPAATVSFTNVNLHLRFDLDVFAIVIPPSDSRGLHLNLRASLDPDRGALPVLQSFDTQIRAKVATLATFTNPAPTAYPSNGGQTWRQAPNGTLVISPTPIVQKRFWA